MRGSRQFECGRLYSPLNLALYPLLHVSVAFHPRDRGLHPRRLRPTVQAGKKQTTRFQNRLETRERLVQLARANRKKAEGTTLSLDPPRAAVFPRRNTTGSRPCTTPRSCNQRLASTGDCWSGGAKHGLLPPPGERGRFRRSAKSFQPSVTQTYRESRESLSFEHGIEGKILPPRLHRESLDKG